jgi:hypothetical protein
VSHVLFGHYARDEALAAVDDCLDRLFRITTSADRAR